MGFFEFFDLTLNPFLQFLVIFMGLLRYLEVTHGTWLERLGEGRLAQSNPCLWCFLMTLLRYLGVTHGTRLERLCEGRLARGNPRVCF